MDIHSIYYILCIRCYTCVYVKKKSNRIKIQEKQKGLPEEIQEEMQHNKQEERQEIQDEDTRRKKREYKRRYKKIYKMKTQGDIRGDTRGDTIRYILMQCALENKSNRI